MYLLLEARNACRTQYTFEKKNELQAGVISSRMCQATQASTTIL